MPKLARVPVPAVELNVEFGDGLTPHDRGQGARKNRAAGDAKE